MNQPGTRALRDEEVSLAEYMGVLWRFRLPLLALTLAAGVVAFFISRGKEPVYLANSKLIVSQSKIGDQSTLSISVGTYRAMVENQSNVLRVMNELGLTGPPYRLTVSRMIDRHLQVDMLPDTNVIEVSARLNDPTLAARFANRLAERAVEVSKEASQQDIVLARDTIKMQLDESRARLTQAESKLEAFRKEARVDAVRKDVSALLDERARLLPLLVEIEAEKARIQQTSEELGKLEKVRNVRRSVSPTTVLNPPQPPQPGQQVAQNQNQPGQPNQQNPQNNQLRPADRVEFKLREDVMDPYVDPVYEILAQQLASSRTRLSGLEKQHAEILRATNQGKAGTDKLSELYTAEAELERLQTELTLSKQVYMDVANRYEQARIQVAARSALLQMVDEAVPPETPVSPRVVRDTLLTTVVAGIIAAVILLLLAVVRPEMRQRA